MDCRVLRVWGYVVQMCMSIKETVEVACSLLVLSAVCCIYLWQLKTDLIYIRFTGC